MKLPSLFAITSTLLVVACVDQSTTDDIALVEPAEPAIIESKKLKDHAIRLEESDASKRERAKAGVSQFIGVSREIVGHASVDAVAMPAQIRPAPPLVYYATKTDRENYQQRAENPVNRSIENPVSTFSIDVDTAGYSNVRRMLRKEGRLPPEDAVKAEEMINYFSYNYAEADSEQQPFSVNTEIAPSPWNDQRYLLQVGLKGLEPPQEQRPNANLVFLVDVSGSMRSPDKLGLVKKSLRLLVNKMSANDTIALSVYAGAAGLVLESTPGSEKAKILQAIDGLEAGGSTNGGAGIQLAYAVAQEQFIKGGINRVIIASDGDMNVGMVNHEALKDLVERKRQSGIALTTLGFGSGNYNDALMEQLADVGNGNAAYIDSLQEANKVLVEEMSATLHTIAKDVKIQVEFNPAVVAEYRLIGYQNRLLNREDFTNDKVDAGEIGAGHTVTALYELSLVGSNAQQLPALRYQQGKSKVTGDSDKDDSELAFVKLRYKMPGQDRSVEISNPVYRSKVKATLAQANSDLRFASAVAGFAQLLRGGKFTGDWGYDELSELARNSRGKDAHGYRSEFIGLVELAKSINNS